MSMKLLFRMKAVVRERATTTLLPPFLRLGHRILKTVIGFYVDVLPLLYAAEP